MTEGRIIKAVSGFYYVKSENNVFQCRGRGIFRKQNITPLVGDFVEFDGQNPKEGYILSIKSRRNMLIRPAVANIDQAIIVSAAVKPDFNPLLLDRFLVMIESEGITPIILITKKDLKNDEELETIFRYQKVYEQIGYSVRVISALEPENVGDLMHDLADKVSVFAGQSGVGKSSLLNVLNTSLQLKTDDISVSLGRGKHTTRHVELVEVNGGLVADTPGFSALDFRDIKADELADKFPEISERQADCKFRGCFHNKEPKCAVKDAVEDGDIASSRYDHYLRFLDEINSRKSRY